MIVEHFYKRDQAAGESYFAELRRLTAKSGFGEQLDEALRDGFVCSLKSEALDFFR